MVSIIKQVLMAVNYKTNSSGFFHWIGAIFYQSKLWWDLAGFASMKIFCMV